MNIPYAATIADLKSHARRVIFALETERDHYRARGNTALTERCNLDIAAVQASLNALAEAK